MSVYNYNAVLDLMIDCSTSQLLSKQYTAGRNRKDTLTATFH